MPRSPRSHSENPAVRPTRPRLAGAKLDTDQPPPAVIDNTPATRSRRFVSGLRSPLATASIILCLMGGIAAATWRVSTPPSDPSLSSLAFDEPQAGSAVSLALRDETHDPIRRLQTADPLRSYFGFPLAGQTIGFVVDGDKTMAPYIDDLAYITNSLTEGTAPGTHRFGIVMATGEEGRTILEVAEPSTNLAGARMVLTSRLPAGRTDLSKALETTAGWYADVVFLVLAKPVDQDQAAILTEKAEQSGAVTHVVALGQAAKQDLSAISRPTGGRFLSVDDQSLTSLVTSIQRAREE